jgi:hypothetical protein
LNRSDNNLLIYWFASLTLLLYLLNKKEYFPVNIDMLSLSSPTKLTSDSKTSGNDKQRLYQQLLSVISKIFKNLLNNIFQQIEPLIFSAILVKFQYTKQTKDAPRISDVVAIVDSFLTEFRFDFLSCKNLIFY